jgi:hypothetical protein
MVVAPITVGRFTFHYAVGHAFAHILDRLSAVWTAPFCDQFVDSPRYPNKAKRGFSSNTIYAAASLSLYFKSKVFALVRSWTYQTRSSIVHVVLAQRSATATDVHAASRGRILNSLLYFPIRVAMIGWLQLVAMSRRSSSCSSSISRRHIMPPIQRPSSSARWNFIETVYYRFFEFFNFFNCFIFNSLRTT